jgi:hypothetical protein
VEDIKSRIIPHCYLFKVRSITPKALKSLPQNPICSIQITHINRFSPSTSHITPLTRFGIHHSRGPQAILISHRERERERERAINKMKPTNEKATS